ncbi:hypothetical protein [uncultured Litoreibacter sp.]|uniref:hypothetical protein n=1 Tax=uncultured Litoreibacter sp. TaxID=1392394 RepID=UPI002601F098|nr:hypothetical protein [uncultured Litoreibacter sp.]
MRIIAIVCGVMLIALAVIGEATLGLFDGDRDLARRATLVAFTLLGGIGFACLQPDLWRWYGRSLQRVIAKGGSQHAVAQRVLREDVPDKLYVAAKVAAVACVGASIALAWHFWSGGS